MKLKKHILFVFDKRVSLRDKAVDQLQERHRLRVVVMGIASSEIPKHFEVERIRRFLIRKFELVLEHLVGPN